ncbi:armadillo-type protein [Phascolomyces articulosus]|uniref:Armadillo-type protein n=1 Tax=Phascolomyces articulosus TaxID=60185 RepID=A0AAD5JL47_9FUNG|nr:armadillo-type protein [Phascolomyces articulosus]
MTILEFLTLVPEEVSNTEIIGGKRAQVLQELKDGIPLVLSTLSSFLITTSSDTDVDVIVQQKALGCLQSWIQYGVDFEEVYLLIRQSMLFLGNEQLFRNAADVLLETMQQSSYAKYNTLRNDLLECFSSDEMRLKLTNCIAEEDDEVGILLAKLLTGFGETFTEYISDHLAAPSMIALLNMIMQLTDFPGYFPTDQEVSEIPLNFWYVLQETLFDDGIIPIRQQVSIVTDADDDVVVDRATTHSEHIAWIRQCGETAMAVYRELVSVMKRKAAFPEDSIWQSWPKGAPILAPGLIYKISILFFQDLEATMFCLKSICEEIPPDENTYIREFFGPKVLGRLPTNGDFRLQNTTLLLMGSLAEWLKLHPEFLPPVMNYIVPCLSVPRLSMSAASAFSDICDTCRESLTDELESLMHSNIMQKVVESVADVIQVLSPERAIAPLMALAGDILQGVGKALNAIEDASIDSREIILAQLQYLSACCRGIQSPNDDYQSLSARNSNYDNFANGQLETLYAKVDGFQQFTSAIYSSVQQIATAWRDDEEIMKALTHFIEAGVRAINPLLTLSFDDLIGLIITSYQATGFGCWLHTATLIITVYGGHEANYSRLCNLLGSLTERTLGFIGSIEGIEEFVHEIFRGNWRHRVFTIDSLL